MKQKNNNNKNLLYRLLEKGSYVAAPLQAYGPGSKAPWYFCFYVSFYSHTDL